MNLYKSLMLDIMRAQKDALESENKAVLGRDLVESQKESFDPFSKLKTDLKFVREAIEQNLAEQLELNAIYGFHGKNADRHQTWVERLRKMIKTLPSREELGMPK